MKFANRMFSFEKKENICIFVFRELQQQQNCDVMRLQLLPVSIRHFFDIQFNWTHGTHLLMNGDENQFFATLKNLPLYIFSLCLKWSILRGWMGRQSTTNPGNHIRHSVLA